MRLCSAVVLAVPFVLACGATPTAPTPTQPPAPECAASVASARSNATAPGSDAASGIDADSTAEALVRAINASDPAPVVARFSAALEEALPPEKTASWFAKVVEAKGKLVSSHREPGGSDRSGNYRVKAERGEWRLELRLDRSGTILGLKLTDPPPPEPEVAKSTIALSLPFRGEWSVFWGGATLEHNQHVPHASQRRAADLLVVDASGKTHRDAGKKNEDFFAYGQEILSVADGTVTAAIDGVPENVPGAMNAYMAFGNMVVIKHADNLYSAYAHLQPRKLAVRVGDKVKRGAKIGLCGNSGNSSEPHLHFQLQDGPLFERSWGVDPVFAGVNVTRGGTKSQVAEYTWLKGDLVSSEPAKRPR